MFTLQEAIGLSGEKSARCGFKAHSIFPYVTLVKTFLTLSFPDLKVPSLS